MSNKECCYLKFKIGDHVKLVDDETTIGTYKVGDTGFVAGSVFDDIVLLMEKDGMPLLIRDQDIEKIESDDDTALSMLVKSTARKTLAISIDGNTVKVTDGKTHGIAKCSPDDDFDLVKGTSLALQRYLDAKKKFPQVGDTYYSVDTDGTVCAETYDDYTYEKKLVAAGNCFKTKEEAEAKAKKFREVLAH